MSCFEGVIPFVFALFVQLLDCLGDAEGFSVERCLGDKTVGEWETQDTCNARGYAKEEDVPMETSWFAKWELASLGDERRNWNKCQ